MPGAGLGEITVNCDGETSCPAELKVQDEPPAIILLGVLNIDLHAPTSAGLNPLPDTTTPVPEGPKLGVSVIVGTRLVTVNVAEARLPLVSVTVTTYTPGVAVEIIVKVEGETTCPVRLMVQEGAGDAAIILLGLLNIEAQGVNTL